MADSRTGPPSVHPIKEKQWQFQKRMEDHYYKRGSRYLPFSIEPMPHARQRLIKPMTAEERGLRKQWVQDQVLSPNEPRNVEIKPMNGFRRFYRKPWDRIFQVLKPFVGEPVAMHIRIVIPKVMIAYGFLFYCYYHLKYNHLNWTKVHGAFFYGRRPAYFPGETVHEDDVKFHDLDFSERKVFLDGNYKTSAAGQD